MRGLVITMDAMIAIVFIFMAALILYSQTFYTYAPRGAYLKQITLDALTVIEKTGGIEVAIEGDSTGVREVIRTAPQHICIQVVINDASGEQVAAILRGGCSEYGKEVQVAVRPFAYQGQSYSVIAHSWYRKGTI